MIPLTAIELDMTLLVQVGSLAAFGGMVWMRVQSITERLDRIDRDVKDHNNMVADIAVIKQQLTDMNQCLRRLSRERDREVANEVNAS